MAETPVREFVRHIVAMFDAAPRIDDPARVFGKYSSHQSLVMGEELREDIVKRGRTLLEVKDGD